MNVMRGEYFYPERPITRGEFVEFLSRFGKLKKNPSSTPLFSDVKNTSTLFTSIQNYGYTVSSTQKNFSPDEILTVSVAHNILKTIENL